MAPVEPDRAFSVRERTERFVQTFAGRAIVGVRARGDASADTLPDASIAIDVLLP